MPSILLRDVADSRVADYRTVSDPQLARVRGVFVAEGRAVVQRLIADKRYRVRSLLLNEASLAALEVDLTTLPRDTPVFVTDAAQFYAIAGFNVHRGCLALADRPIAQGIADVIRHARTLVLLEQCGNADNMGGVFRNAAAFGADAVLISPGSCDPLYRKTIRTSMATALSVPYALAAPWPEVLETVRAAGFHVVALTPREPSLTLEAFADMPPPARLALLLGAEGPGLSETAIDHADSRLRIPMTAAVDSLNLAVAAGIVLSRLSGRAPL